MLPIITARIPAEILAGITLAAIDVPEVIGYTKIAGAAGPSQSLVAARSGDPRLSRIFDESGLVETLSIARRCHRTIIQNLVGTLVVDSIGVGLAAFGFLNPLLAAFIHVSSEMAFILNSPRLLPPVSSANKLVRGFLAKSPATPGPIRVQ